MKRIFPFAVLIFLMCLGIGFWIAANKYVWNDEYYSVTNSTLKRTYVEILQGRVDEGNNSPLFYITEKVLCDLTHYKAPQAWVEGDRSYDEFYSRIFLRIIPVIFMSLAIAIIFWYFATYYSAWTGVYALFVTLSSYMVWSYWAEARPYAMWFFLTTVQSLIFITLLKKGFNWGLMAWMTITYYFLSLTVVFGAAQIAISAILLGIFLDRRWYKYLPGAIIPIGICIFYYSTAPKYEFWFLNTPIELFMANIPKDRLILLTVLGGFALWMNRTSKEIMGYFSFTVMMMMAVTAVLCIFKYNESVIHQGFSISNRYFIHLSAVGIIALTLLTHSCVQGIKNPLFKKIVVMGFVLLLGWRLLKTYQLLQAVIFKF